ncbi:unnamed protein product, partial [Iphiclides podalirius]
MSAEREPDREQEGNTETAEGERREGEKEMQTVVSNYVAPNLIGQADRLIEANYSNEYSIDYYGERVDSLDGQDEKIEVDDDRDEELVIADDCDATKSDVDCAENRGDERIQSEEQEDRCRTEGSYEPSWHPHVYGKPPKKPTPHTIEYILGLSDKTGQEEPRRSTVSQLMNVKRNFETKKQVSQEKGTQVQDSNERRASSVHKNRLQEQLLQRGVRTDSDCAVQYGFKVDEPLNLSVPKVKESPGWGSVDEDKLLKDASKLVKRKKSTEDVRSPLGGEGSLTSEEGEESAAGRRKKARTTFTGRQIFELEKLFEVKKYLSSGERADMAKLLNVTETQDCNLTQC